jgi:hypothetical protein
MAAGILARPGTTTGPCKVACAHRDCAETRGMAATLCADCQKPIGYGVRFYRDEQGGLVHAACFEEAIEREMVME